MGLDGVTLAPTTPAGALRNQVPGLHKIDSLALSATNLIPDYYCLVCESGEV